METCQSGLTYLFAKEAGALNPLEGSNPSVSAKALEVLRCQNESVSFKQNNTVRFNPHYTDYDIRLS